MAKPEHLDAKDRAKIIALLSSDEYEGTPADIAKRFRISRGQVYMIAREAGVWIQRETLSLQTSRPRKRPRKT